MSTRSLGTLTLDLITKIGGFEQGFDKAARVADSRSKQIQQSLRTLTAGIAGVFAGINASQAIGEVINLADELGKLATTSGITGRAASELQRVFQQNDLDVNQLGASLQKMSVSLANNAAVYKRLGLSVDDLKSKDADAAFEDIADAIASISNPADRARAATDIFGDDLARKLLPVLEQGKTGIQGMRRELGGIANEDIEQLQAADEAFKKLTFLKEDIWTKLAIKVAGVSEMLGLIDRPIRDQLSVELYEATKEVTKLEEALKKVNRPRMESMDDPFALNVDIQFDEETIRADIEEWQGKITAIMEEIRKMDEAEAKAKTSRASGSQSSEDRLKRFDAEVARLNEVIAVYGQTGDAARLSYQIQIGALGELSRAEQQQLIALADQVDGLKAAEDSVKRLSDEYTALYATIAEDSDPLAALTELTGGIDELLTVPLEIRQAENFDEMLNSLGIYVEDVQLSYEQMYAAIDEQRKNDLISEQQAAAARKAIADMERDARFQAANDLFGGLSDLMGTHSKKAFEIGKAAAIANATVYAMEAIIGAYRAPTWWEGVAQAVGATATLYAQIDQLKNVQFQGFMTGGYTGNGGIGDVAGVVHGREFVFDAASTARIGIGNLDALREGGDLSSSVQLNVINQTGIPMQAEWVSREEVRLIVAQGISQQTPKLVAAQLAMPNSVVSKSLSRNTKTTRNR